MLAADVSLVASGVGKGCTPENLKDFLASKGINAVEVTMLTRTDIIEQVRTLTFRVVVQADQYEAALRPEVWPYRVGVRHYRAPRRDRTENTWQGQAEKTGGLVENVGTGGVQGRDQHGHPTGSDRHGAGAQQRQFLPPGHPGLVGKDQQNMRQIQPGPIELNNMYSILAALGGMASPRQ